MTKHIYIVNEYLSSAKNGIGTYLNELLYCLQAVEASVCLLTFNADCREFNMRYRNRLSEMKFPFFPKDDFRHHPTVIRRFLRLHIIDSSDTVFCFNYSASEKLMQMVRETFPLSKQIYVIHDFSWTGLLLGSRQRLKRVLAGECKANPDNQSDFIIHTWQQEKQMMGIADKVVCLSEGTFRVLTDIYGVDKQKINLIPNGLRNKRGIGLVSDEVKEQWRRQCFIPRNKKILLFVGRTSKEKGFSALMDALRIIVRSVPNIQLVVAGSPSPFCFSFSQDIASLVTYTGHISGQNLMKWYQVADVGIIPSYTEQCSYVGIEMMMYGLPIVASDGFGVQDMFHEGVNAVVAPIGRTPKDFSNHLAEAIIKLLNSPELCDKLRQGARLEYERKYHIKYMRQRYKELLASL